MFISMLMLFPPFIMFVTSREISYTTRDIEPLEKSVKNGLHIKIGVLLPNLTKEQCGLMKVLPAIDVAIDFVRKDMGLFNYSQFSITYSDSEANLSVGPLKAIDIFNDNMATVLLGPVDSFILASVVRFSSYRYKVPILSAQGFASDLGNKQFYPLLTRLSGTYKDMGDVFLQIFQKFNWKSRLHTTVILWLIWNKLNNFECNFQIKPILENFKKNEYKFLEINDEFSNMGEVSFDERIRENLERIKKNARS